MAYVTVTVATNMYYSNRCNRQGKAGLLNVATKPTVIILRVCVARRLLL